MNGTGCNLVNLPFKTLGSQYFNNFECSDYLKAWKEKLKREGKLIEAICTVISDVPKDYESEKLYTDEERNEKEKLPQQNCQYKEPPDKAKFLANNKNSVGEDIEDIEYVNSKFYLFQTQQVEQVDATTSRIFLPESKGTSMMSFKDEECSVFVTSWRTKLSLGTFSPQQEFLCKETFIEYERDNTDCMDDTVEEVDCHNYEFKPQTEYTGSILFSNEECEVYLKQWRDRIKHEHPESFEIIMVEKEKLRKRTITARDSVKSISIGGNEDEITETENSLNQSKQN